MGPGIRQVYLVRPYQVVVISPVSRGGVGLGIRPEQAVT